MDIVKHKYQIYPMYLDGKWVGSDNEFFTEVINPATKEVIGAVPTGGAYEAEKAVDAAYDAFKIGLNDALPSAVQVPFGGYKESGLDREGGHHGIEEFLEVKYISIGLDLD